MAYIRNGLVVWPDVIPEKYRYRTFNSELSGYPIFPKVVRLKGTVTTDSAPIQMLPMESGKYLNQGAFAQFYYHLIPSTTGFSLGVVTGDKVEKMYVFNGFFEDVSITNIKLNNLFGVEVKVKGSPTLPVAIKPLSSVEFEIKISSKGSAVVDGTVELSFSNGYKNTIRFEGTRLILWKFQPNWVQSVREQFEYKTDIMTSYSRKEQRRGFMVQPRRRMAFTCNPNRNGLQDLRNIIHNWQNKAFMMPLWWQNPKLVNPASKGDKEITIDNIGLYDFVVGGSLTLWQSQTLNEVLEIAAIDGNKITLATAISYDFLASATVYPSYVARLPEEVELSVITSELGEIELEAVADQSQLKIKMPESGFTPDKTYKGVEVLERKPNWVDPLTETYQAKIEELDYGYGVRQYLPHQSPSLVQREMQYLLTSYQDIVWWQAFIHRQKGALKSFYVPSHACDLRLVADIKFGEAKMYVSDEYFSKIVGNSRERQLLRLQTKQKVYYLTVLSVQGVSEGALLVVDIPFDANIPIQDVTQISFMQRMRFASDTVEFDYQTHDKAILNIVLQQLREI